MKTTMLSETIGRLEQTITALRAQEQTKKIQRAISANQSVLKDLYAERVELRKQIQEKRIEIARRDILATAYKGNDETK